ncbi:M28 family metallopeptidase [Aquimonas sp.]|jgi:Zn-dependent M28 family amino/carboxypeptidase|uniref:M28 family metallopeptidase n=1 Tax=Aquimonas sp. TaxID=1872588 RepID=UPI0037BFBFA6
MPRFAYRSFALSTALSLALAACAPAPAPIATPAAFDEATSARRIEADLRFLADDLLEGRAAATRGFDIAALYVAAEYSKLGLEPAGDDGSWFQSVPLIEAQRVPGAAELKLTGTGALEGRSETFEFQVDFLPGINFNANTHSVEAPLVFVGQGVVAPEFEHDDFRGIDLRGKVAVVLSGAPERFPNDERAYYSSGIVKSATLVERGAVGVIYLGDPEREAKSPWARGARNWLVPGMRLRGDDGKAVDSFPELTASASLGAHAAARVFAGSAMEADEVFARLKRGELSAFELPWRVRLAGQTRQHSVTSRNVVGRLPGTDPQRAAEHVVLTAHLDHVGIGAPVEGDNIYNGAFDNALGTSILIEAARLAVAQPRPQRSQLFIALTAEEKGLLGAEYFARWPTVAKDGIVANVNMDMPVMLTDLRDVMPIGVENSSLAPIVKQVAAELGIELSADPRPEEVVFVRSDQYAFIRQGVPAVYMDGGVVARDPAVNGLDQLDEFLRQRYHQPNDDANQPIHYPSAARLARLNQVVAARVADAADRPRWNEGNFFGTRFAAGK